jgi:hypothetical protein
MRKSKLQILMITIMLVVTILGLGGCRRQDTTTNKQLMPLAGSGNSPLPTPGGGGENSPLPTPGVADSPVTP